jgi:hypothetical protein
MMKTGALKSTEFANFRKALLAGTAALAFLAATSLPVTFEADHTLFAANSAQAGNGNENGNGDGQDKGKGNGKGQGDENRGGNDGNGKPPLPDDDGDDGDDVADDDDDGPGGSGFARDGGGGAAAGDADEDSLAAAIDAVDGTPASGPVGTPAAALPTIKQIFAMGEEAVLSAEAELEAIRNGWGGTN